MAKRGRKSSNPLRDLMVAAVEEPLRNLLKELKKEQKSLEKTILKEVNRIWKELEKLASRTGARQRGAGAVRTARTRRSGRKPGRKPKFEKCTIPGCGRPHYAKGLCTRHYQQWRKGKISLPSQEEKTSQDQES